MTAAFPSHAPPILCIGGAAVDRKFRLAEPPRAATSNPGRGVSSFGGVARNVAENLARLGRRAALISAVGDDADGAALVAHLAALGVDTDGVLRRAGAGTAQYVAILGPDGSLAMAVADMSVLDEAYGELAAALEPRLAEGAWVFADCNAPATALERLVGLARARGARLALDAISAAKARRLPADLTGVACLFLNLDEARSLLGQPRGEPGALAAALLARGASALALTLGADGALVCDGESAAHVPAEPAEVADVTGAGDSMIAGALHGLSLGLDLRDAARLGAHLAARTVASAFTVDPALSPAVAARFIENLSRERLTRCTAG